MAPRLASHTGDRLAIKDYTGTDVVNLRRVIYLTIRSEACHEAVGHKLLKLKLAPGEQFHIVDVLIETCIREPPYQRFFGQLSQGLCQIRPDIKNDFESAFTTYYKQLHRLTTEKLRPLASLFAQLLATDAISWHVCQVIVLTEDDTTSSSRIFIKILFQELCDNMDLVKLNNKLHEPGCARWCAGIFPHDSPRHMRFCIKFWTAVGLGGLTDAMRMRLTDLAQAQQAAAAAAEASSDSSSSSSSSSSDSSSSSSSSDLDSSASERSSVPPPPAQRKRPLLPVDLNTEPVKRSKIAESPKARSGSRNARPAQRSVPSGRSTWQSPLRERVQASTTGKDRSDQKDRRAAHGNGPRTVEGHRRSQDGSRRDGR